MRKYFEYEWNDQVRTELLQYYNSRKGRSDLDNTEKKVALKIDRISSCIPFNSQDFICDVGCSDGSLLKHIKGKYKKAVGFDISEKVIEADRKLGMNYVEFRTYDGVNIHTDEPFDKIFLMDVLEHAFEPDQLIHSIFENLKSGGVFIMQVPSTGWLSELVFGRYHYGHLRYYDEKYLFHYLENAGFKVRHIETFHSVPWSQKFINYRKIFNVLNAVCNVVPHALYPYYGSVAAIAEK